MINNIFKRKCEIKDPVSNLWFHEEVDADDQVMFGGIPCGESRKDLTSELPGPALVRTPGLTSELPGATVVKNDTPLEIQCFLCSE